MDIKSLKNQLEQMVWLPPDWNGFGSIAITAKVYDIGNKLISLLNNDYNISSIKLLVGIEVPGSLLILTNIGNKQVDMVIELDGSITYDECIYGECISSGAFILSKSNLDAILT